MRQGGAQLPAWPASSPGLAAALPALLLPQASEEGLEIGALLGLGLHKISLNLFVFYKAF